ncbi:4-hydroxyphenylpyruvate dioxygenase [Catellatospora bangladeshensis]|uniref:4-hydroxyphenylpyruvate dioxygenase n=1 Tax=Catellatospora bangladeshensis TaxID=310355 RepID=A0A8J3JDJ3_9ACTN|nr:4-hydroxyphenylpyruvate dioxygenase [Catellatospora bangladeshensis]GIF78691.1 4-hydroxyphenylpyruvate dioxygenase [Catellatospora bangladeshensis]
MNILGIDHLEFYVGDARQTAYYLCTAFGFRVCGQGGPQTGLTGQRSLLLQHGDIRIVLTSGLVPEHPATQYVGRHGDGVAIIAFQTDDATGLYEAVVSRGAAALAGPQVHENADGRVVTASVSGFGDVTHRLVERHGNPWEFLPGTFEMTLPEQSFDADLLRVIDHCAICVPAGELGATSRYYQDVFGFAEIFEEYIEVGGQGMDSKVVQSQSRQVTFTLIEPDLSRKPGQIDDFLSWHAGAGVQHVAFRTDDIVTAVRTFAEKGVGFLSTPQAYFDALEQRLGSVDLPIAELRSLGVLVDTDHYGQLYQIFTQSMHVRRTLFLELIERHGALTFGSSNIKALYEAKERELARPGDAAAEAAPRPAGLAAA